MNQGKASRDGSYGRKREPVVHAINPSAVSQLGNAQGSHVTNKGGTGYRGDDFDLGRGFTAPRNKSQSSTNRGSQGRY
jgi:hypothetical protein